MARCFLTVLRALVHHNCMTPGLRKGNVVCKKKESTSAPTFAAANSAVLREETPPGYNKKLRESVLYEADESGFSVGYETGVDTAGGQERSVTRPRTSGRSVLARRGRRWVSVEELETVLEEAWDSRSDEILSIIERSVASGIS